MTDKIIQLKNKFEKNFTSTAIRKIICFDAAFLIFMFFVSLSTFSDTRFFFWIFLGGILSFWNFFFLALFIQKYFNSKMLGTNMDKFLPYGQILVSNLRLFLTGILLYVFLVQWNANPIALLIGLSVPVATIPILLIYYKKK